MIRMYNRRRLTYLEVAWVGLKRINKPIIPAILQGNHWCNPKPVCFDSLPQQGWIAKDKFDWNKSIIPEGCG